MSTKVLVGYFETKARDRRMVEINAALSKSGCSGEISNCNTTNSTIVHALQESETIYGWLEWVCLELNALLRVNTKEVFEARQHISESVGEINAFGFQWCGARNNARAA